MSTATAGARCESLEDEAEQASLRYAMLSVYYQTVGGQLESRGAPVIAVPLGVQPLTLEDALDRLEELGNEQRLWDAYWCIVRSVPVEGWRHRGSDRRRRPDHRYPRAFVERLERLTPAAVDRLDDLRQRARDSAHLLSTAIVAAAESRKILVAELARVLETRGRSDPVARELEQATAKLLGRPSHDFVRWLAEDGERTGEHVDKLQAEVGLNLNDFVEDFVDTVAFAHFKQELGVPEGLLTSSCVVRQDTTTLTTTATVTTLVRTDFDMLARAIDPLGWPKCSDVIRETKYIEDPFALDSDVDEEPLGTPFTAEQGPRFLFEDVGVHWGEIETTDFRNVLTIDRFAVDPETATISLPFKLARSVDSRILWDYRSGGILIDGGFLVARPVGEDCWRVTSRKVLKFSDRTPYSNLPGWLDFGQLLNYLAPASVTWWLETEMYSTSCPLYASAATGAPSPADGRGSDEIQATEGAADG